MCGIAGIIDKNGDPISLNEIKEMTDVIKHRGPDGEGFFLENNFALGHRRLSIIDLSQDASQPMHYLEKFTLIFNGEIYNYIELKDQLMKLNYIFNTASDTEVILAAYDYWGESCVEHFNGMWAFALYDKEQQKLFCSRDRYGIKPFYFYEKKDRFCFGSEIKQLLPFLTKRSANKQILLDYLFTGVEDYTNETFFKDINKLPSGHNLIYDLKKQSYQILRYYQLKTNKQVGTEDFEKTLFQFQDLLKDSIALRLRSDVKVGTCLSGGLDSSAIATFAVKNYNYDNLTSRFGAIHARSIEEKTDESFFAENVANTSDIDLFITSPDKKDFNIILEDVIRIQEEPFGSPSIMMQYFVFQKAKEAGMVVMLDGQGGDELLLGYDRYFVAWLKSSKGFAKLAAFRNAIKNSKLSSLQLIKYYLYFTNAKVRKAKLRSKFSFINSEYLDQLSMDLLKKLSTSFNDLNQLQRDEVFDFQLPHLLKYEDRNSMAHSIESRFPFLDYRFLEYSLSLPPNYKIKEGWSKYILRKSVETLLDKEVVWRRNKLGFEAPVKTWMSDRESINGIIKDSDILQKLLKSVPDHFADLSVLWRLYNIALWEKTFNIVWDE